MKYFILSALFVLSPVHADRISVTEVDAEELEKVLDLGYEHRSNLKMSGYYEANGKVLNGDLLLISYRSSLLLDYPNEYLDSVAGSYTDNKKTGDWVYRHIVDDSVDMYASFTVVITYEDGVCIKSQFFGGIGHSMINKKHVFQSPDLCSLESVVEKAWGLWVVEFEKGQ